MKHLTLILVLSLTQSILFKGSQKPPGGCPKGTKWSYKERVCVPKDR